MNVELESPWSYQRATPEQIAEQSNGIGPDRWPKELREHVTDALSLFAPAAVIHDWEFGPLENDGTLERWHEANARFRENCYRLVRAKYAPWRLIRRCAALAVADSLYWAIESHAGRKAWVEAFERSTSIAL